MRLAVPTLSDDTIRLRPPEAGDAAAVAAAVQDPDIPRFTMVPSPYTVADAVAYIERSAASWRSGDAAPLRDRRRRGRRRSSDPSGSTTSPPPTPHVGYWVAASARGRGVATRALRLVARWALEDLGFDRLELYTFVENHRSQRVASRAGFTCQGVQSLVDHPSGRDELVLFSRSGPAELATGTAP